MTVVAGLVFRRGDVAAALVGPGSTRFTVSSTLVWVMPPLPTEEAWERWRRGRRLVQPLCALRIRQGDGENCRGVAGSAVAGRRAGMPAGCVLLSLPLELCEGLVDASTEGKVMGVVAVRGRGVGCGLRAGGADASAQQVGLADAKCADNSGEREVSCLMNESSIVTDNGCRILLVAV